MATKTETDPRWAELQSRGYSLRDLDGDVAVALYYKEAFINDYHQTKVDMNEIITDAQEYWQEIMQNVGGLKHCRNCVHWHYTAQFAATAGFVAGTTTNIARMPHPAIWNAKSTPTGVWQPHRRVRWHKQQET